MAIYTPAYAAGRDQQAALKLIQDHPFATLITSVAGEEPQITYVPLLCEATIAPMGRSYIEATIAPMGRSYIDGALLGHVARANPHWQKFGLGPTVALFHGPHAFISPYWYEKPQDNVPTWNYAVVHAHGRPEVQDGAHNREHLERLFARFGGGQPLPTDPAKVERLLGGIVAFRMPIDRLEAKFKMNQNKTAADRAGVVRDLRASGFAESAATADWMEAHDKVPFHQ